MAETNLMQSKHSTSEFLVPDSGKRFFASRVSVKGAEGVSNCLTFDVEDYFQVETLKPWVDFKEWSRYEIRVQENVGKVLEALDAFSTPCTFFVLGWIAERLPDMVRTIHDAGHEIASHGYAHQLICEQTRDEFREDIRKTKAALEDITGEAVLGYRAPTFSVTSKTLWALDILAEEGYRYDSSVFPVRHDRYGIPGWNRYIDRVDLPNGKSITEVPPLTARVMGLNMPFGGGGYFRLAPLSAFCWAIRRMNADGHPAIMYVHPWELDPGQPRFPVPPLHRFRHYVNLSTTERKLRSLLATFPFTRLRDHLFL